jgi:L-ascorbate metabolism protein UlaG (beta-lactamase superfamily)
MRIEYVGHATVEIAAGGTRLVTDPVLRTRVANLHRIAPLGSWEELRSPHAVLISHAHMDHLDPPSLRLLAPHTAIAPRHCGRLLRRAGIRDVREVIPGERLRVGAAELTAVRLAHDGRRHPLSRARETLGFLVDAGQRALFAGDTDLFDGMRGLSGGLDVALLPVWGWGPRLGRGHLDPERAARAAALVQPRVAIPIHWGTLASARGRSLDDPTRPALEFERHAAELAPAVEVRVLAPGESTIVR